jgi:type II secretory pathway pseudopilin PulG
MKTRKGFTVLEVIIVILFASIGLVLFFLQKVNVDAMKRDENRKIAINAMYFALEESFYKENGYYPAAISPDNLSVIDPALFTDPFGINIGDPMSSYTYEPTNCDNDKCQSYILRSLMEKEAEFIRQSRK